MPARRHHAVPRFYLSRFADEDGLIWLHDLQRHLATKVSPRDAIVEKHLYAPEVGENPKDDTIEKFLAEHIESPAAPAIERLASGDSVSDEDRQRIALFVAYQEFRVPRIRDAIQRMMTEVGERVLAMSVQHPESMKRTFAEMGKPISDEDLAKLTNAVKTGGIAVQATKVPWLASAAVPTEIASMLTRMPWAVVEAPDRMEFITSDSPVVKVLTDRKVPPMLAGGWLSPSAESTIALDPWRVLVIRPDGKEGRFGISKLWCKDVNRRTVRQARRFVVSFSRDSYIEKIARKRFKSAR